MLDEAVEEVHPHAGWVRDEDARRLLSFVANIYGDRADDHEDLPADFRESRFFQEVLSTHGTDSLTEAVDEGNISVMNYATGYTSTSEDGQKAILRMADLLANEGAVAIVVGPMGSGKTAMTVDVVRVWKAITGGHVVGNVDWEGLDAHETTSAGMLDYMASVRGPVLAFIDEAAQALGSRGADQGPTNQFAKDLKLVRKKEDGDQYAKQGSVVAIGHEETDVGAPIRRVASQMFKKPSREDPTQVKVYESEGGKDSFSDPVSYRGVTDTAEEFDQYDASPFTVVDRNADDSEDGDNGPDADEVARREAIATAIRANKPWSEDEGMSYAEIGKRHPDEPDFLVDYSDRWVGKRVREWKDGQHRDVVEPPEGTA
jgi:energy-coupling factor transporter ATP-binding protein EcfA2